MLKRLDGTIEPQRYKNVNHKRYDYTVADDENGNPVHMIERDGILYSDALDPYHSDRLYNETEIPVDGGDEEPSEVTE